MKTMMKRTMLAVGAIALMGAMSGRVALAGEDCASYGGFINQPVEDDVLASGINCTIGPRGSVSGDLVQMGTGTVTIQGIVYGDVTEDGAGDVQVTGLVYGKIDEQNAGVVNIRVAAGKTFEASVFESGLGAVTIFGGGGSVIKTNVDERDAGGVIIDLATNDQYDGTVLASGSETAAADSLVLRTPRSTGGELFKGLLQESGGASVSVQMSPSGLLEGNVYEAGIGNLTLTATMKGGAVEQDNGNLTVTLRTGSFIEGTLEESGAGNALVTINGGAELKGNVIELGSGNLTTRGTGFIVGNTEHELPGTCTNTIPASNINGEICKRIG